MCKNTWVIFFHVHKPWWTELLGTCTEVAGACGTSRGVQSQKEKLKFLCVCVWH